MNSFEEIIKGRGITQLCHFTKSISLPFIFGKEDFNVIPNGIISRELIEQSDLYSSLPIGTSYTDPNRYDGKRDRISVSIQFPNIYYFNAVQEREDGEIPFRDWCILLINPNIIGEDTLFSPANAGLKGISSKMAKNEDEFKGPKAFEYLFNDQIKITSVNGGTYRHYTRQPLFCPDNIPTCIQAELLIKNRIPYENIMGIVFENEKQAILERERLLFCDTFNLDHLDFYVCPEMFHRPDNDNVLTQISNAKLKKI